MTNSNAQSRAPFWTTALVLWILAIAGAVLLMPYLATLENKAFAEAAAKNHMPVRQLLAFTVAQSAATTAIAVLLGLWASRKLGLTTPLITALVTRKSPAGKVLPTLLLAFALGVVFAVALWTLDHFVFAPIPSVALLIHNAETGSAKTSALQGFMASFYGGLDEEILIRLCVMSVLALIFRTITRMLGRNREVALPNGVFWVANVLAAVAFGLGHLPATAALAPLSMALAIRAVVLNGTVGILFGVLYRRYGLEWAMASHFGVDMVVHVVGA
jgi:hypothetical protein